MHTSPLSVRNSSGWSAAPHFYQASLCHDGRPGAAVPCGWLGRHAIPHGYLHTTASESAADDELLTGTGAPSEAISAWPVAEFLPLRAHGESLVASVERWLCNHQSADLVRWNSAMTGRQQAPLAAR